MTTFISRSEADRFKRDDSRTAVSLALAFTEYPTSWWVERTTKSGPRLPSVATLPVPVFLVIIDNEQVAQVTTAAQTVIPTSRYQFVSPGDQDIHLGDKLTAVEDATIKFSVTSSEFNGEMREGDLEVAR